MTVRRYSPGDTIDVVVDIVTNHLGYFEFSVCPRDTWEQLETEKCFDSHILEVLQDAKVPSLLKVSILASLRNVKTTQLRAF